MMRYNCLILIVFGILTVGKPAIAFENVNEILEAMKSYRHALLGRPLEIGYRVELRPKPENKQVAIEPNEDGYRRVIISTHTPNIPIEESFLTLDYHSVWNSKDWWYIESQTSKARWDGNCYIANHYSNSDRSDHISSTFIKSTPDSYENPLTFLNFYEQLSLEDIVSHSFVSNHNSSNVVIEIRFENSPDIKILITVSPEMSFCLSEAISESPMGDILIWKFSEFIEVESGLWFPSNILKELIDQNGTTVRQIEISIQQIKRLTSFDPQNYLITPKIPTIVFDRILDTSYPVMEKDDVIGPW